MRFQWEFNREFNREFDREFDRESLHTHTDYPDDYSFESGLELRKALFFYLQFTEWHTLNKSSGKIPKRGKLVNPAAVRTQEQESENVISTGRTAK